MPTNFPNLPTMAEVNALRHATSKAAMTSRTADRKADDKQARKHEATFIEAVRRLDKWTCRCCRRKVVKTIEHVWNRAEVHHLERRATLDTRYDVRNGVLLCLEDHERVTGTIGKSKLVIVPSRFFVLNGKRYGDARKRLHFEESV